MMEKKEQELCPGSPDAGSGPGRREGSAIISRQNGYKKDEEPRREKREEENEDDGEEEEEEKGRGGFFKGVEETDDVPLQNSSNGTSISIIINGVAKETASHNALDLKREVPVIELSRRDAIKAVQRRTESHLVPITELRRPPPLPLPPPQRDDARMVQLSPNAFPVPARAMLYNLAQPLAAINSLGGESEQYSMYPSNRVKRRPAPYEVELDEGRRILDLYKYGKMHFCCVLLLPIKCPFFISIVIHPLTWTNAVSALSVAEDALLKKKMIQRGMKNAISGTNYFRL
uniref:T-cell acute lymphocytic leukemia 1 n=1 Tax=Nothobranchius rachovii TaxID=451742 RepID=A0A1A8QVM4_9TELE